MSSALTQRSSMASKDRLVPDVRINFQLCHAEHPLLTDELLRSRKGRPRHSRLASLAYLGLLAEKSLMHAPPVQHTASRKHPTLRRIRSTTCFSCPRTIWVKCFASS